MTAESMMDTGEWLPPRAFELAEEWLADLRIDRPSHAELLDRLITAARTHPSSPDLAATTTREDAPGAGGGAAEVNWGPWERNQHGHLQRIGKGAISAEQVLRMSADPSLDRCEAERLTWAASNGIERMSDEAIRAWREAWRVRGWVSCKENDGSAVMTDASCKGSEHAG